MRAARICFQNWLDERGGSGDAESRAVVSQTLALLEAHGACRFQNADYSGAPIPRQLGFFREFGEGETWEREFLIPPETIKREIVRGSPLRAALEALKAAQILIPSRDGSLSAETIRIPALGGVHRFYRLRFPKLDDSGASQASQA